MNAGFSVLLQTSGKTGSGDDSADAAHRPSLLDEELPAQDTTRNMAAKWKGNCSTFCCT